MKQATWSDRCLIFATVDLPTTYGARLQKGEVPPHWETIIRHPRVDGIRLNLTKPWHADDIAALMGAARAAGKEVMVDIIEKLRLRRRDGGLQVALRTGSTLTVDAREGRADGKPPLVFSRPLCLDVLAVGQPVVIRDRRVIGHVASVDHARGSVEIAIDWAEEPTCTFLAPPANLPGYKGIDWTPTSDDADKIQQVIRSQAGATAIAFSFVEDFGKVLALCAHLYQRAREVDTPMPRVILKIETAHGVESLPTILQKACALCFPPLAVEIARGDLDNEVDLDLAWAQESCLLAAHERGIPVGVATGLLSSLRLRPHASRAEKLDVWYALERGASFLVLTDETANEARYPAEAIGTLAALIDRARALRVTPFLRERRDL